LRDAEGGWFATNFEKFRRGVSFGSMKLIGWNPRGLGNDRAVGELLGLKK
jgi:hypothetical protein